MRISKTKFYSFLMALVMLWSAMPIFSLPVCAEDVAQAAVTEDDLRAAVESQIRAFAKSINQSNADDAAAKALAKHGLSGGGKKLSVGKSHALTATIWNSEMMQQLLLDTCAPAIAYMQKLDLTTLDYVETIAGWNGAQSVYHARLHTTEEEVSDNADVVWAKKTPYTGGRNAYDQSLDWMVGKVDIDFYFQRKKVTAETVTYEVSCMVNDRFDFSTSSNSGFKNLISGLGALLFREFDWESKVIFELVVPYSCTHMSGIYHWRYDPDQHEMISDSSGGFTKNDAIRYTYTTESGLIQYYYELENTVRLFHNKPWVIEYQVCKPGYVAFSPLENTDNQQSYLLHHSRNSVMAVKMERVVFSESEANRLGLNALSQKRTYRYGTATGDLFSYSYSQTYTFRLENVIREDGSNMIWLTAYNDDLQTMVLNVPMDDYYLSESWGEKDVLKSTDSNGISGEDFWINFIGNATMRFSADYFDLRIWENGIDGADGTYCTSKVTKPTCTKGGYTTYTCTLCGYSFTGDKTAAKGHTYKTQVTAPTCTEKGFTTHTCSCGESYVDSYVEALSHSYKNGICSVCGEKNPVFFGDLDEDGVITTTDTVLLRRYIAGGYGVTLNPSAADLNSDGVLTSTDVVILRRYIAGGYGIELPQT